MAESGKKLYLFFYNLSMFLGFAYVLAVMSSNFLANPDVFPTQCWATVGSFFKASGRHQSQVDSSPRCCTFWCTWRCWTLCLVSPRALFQQLWFRSRRSNKIGVIFLLPGVREKYFPLGAHWQRRENAVSTFRLLSFYDLLKYWGVQVCILLVYFLLLS